LRKLNSSLRGLVIELVNRPEPDVRVQGLWEAVIAELEEAGWEELPRQKWNAYGELDSVEDDWKLDSDPGGFLRTVVTKLWVPCGGADPDTIVYVFEKKGRSWELVLQTEGDYEPRFDGNDALGFQFQISPPDENGRWFLSIATLPPVCDLRPLTVTYRVLRAGNVPERPLEILKMREELASEAAPPYELRTEMDWISMTRPVRRRLDGEPGITITRWRIQGNAAERTFPLADDPEDFLDAWVQLPWAQAKSWSALSGHSHLQDWHGKLDRVLPGSIGLSFVQPCPAEGWKEQWQIGLYLDFRGQEIMNSEELFATVGKERGVFRVESVAPQRAPGCPGETRPKEKLFTRNPD
jgi:hypothetical protein